MNRKISSELAIGVILIIATIIIFSVWQRNKQISRTPTAVTLQPIESIQKPKSVESDNEKLNIANPASEFCIEKGGKLEIRTNADKSQTGFCIFSDGKECEEWEYYRGDCSENISIEKLDLIAKNMIADKEINENYLKYLCRYDETNCGSSFFYTGKKFGNQYKIVFLSNYAEENEKNDPFNYSSEIYWVDIKNGDVYRNNPVGMDFDYVTKISVGKK